jgi:hypothetical protein
MTSSRLYNISRNMTGEERMKKCWELTEWSMKLNPRWKEEIEKRMEEGYTLR